MHKAIAGRRLYDARDEDCHRHRRHLHLFKNRPNGAALIERYQPLPNAFNCGGISFSHFTSQMRRDALLTSHVDLHQRPVPDKGTACANRVACCAGPLEHLGFAIRQIPDLWPSISKYCVVCVVAIPVARVAGIALIALGIACWPGPPPLVGMLSYSVSAMLYLAYLGLAGSLWSVVVLHLILTALLIRDATRTQRDLP